MNQPEVYVCPLPFEPPWWTYLQGSDRDGCILSPCLFNLYAAAAKSLESCPTLCNPIDGSSPGSPVPGILQARILEWVAISFSNAWKWKVKGKLLSRVRLFSTPWTAAYQAPPSVGPSRQDKANINKPTKKLTVIVGDFNIPFSSWIDHPDKN